MNSSNSQHSQPPSSPNPGLGSVDGSRTRYGGSTGESSENYAPEGDNSSSCMQWNSSSDDQPENEEEMVMDTTNSTGKEKDIGTAISSRKREGKVEEIDLLTGLYSLRNNLILSGNNDQRDFYKFWIEEEGDYASKQELDEKVDELHARFLKNMDKNVDGPTDPIDVEILRLSHWIWGDEIDSSNESFETVGGDQDQDSKDSCADVKTGDDGVNRKHESAKARHGIDNAVSKLDSTAWIKKANGN